MHLVLASEEEVKGRDEKTEYSAALPGFCTLGGIAYLQEKQRLFWSAEAFSFVRDSEMEIIR